MDKIVGCVYAGLQKCRACRLISTRLPVHLISPYSTKVKCNPIFEYTKYCCWVIAAFLAGVRVVRY